MKALISLAIIAAVCFGGYKVWEYYQQMEQQRATTAPVKQINPQELPGVPPHLEASLIMAQKGGTKALREWLDTQKRAAQVKDPRLAWIELDYVLLVTREDPIEAKRVFAAVKKRTPTDSPVYPRIQAMEKTYD